MQEFEKKYHILMNFVFPFDKFVTKCTLKLGFVWILWNSAQELTFCFKHPIPLFCAFFLYCSKHRALQNVDNAAPFPSAKKLFMVTRLCFCYCQNGGRFDECCTFRNLYIYVLIRFITCFPSTNIYWLGKIEILWYQHIGERGCAMQILPFCK